MDQKEREERKQFIIEAIKQKIVAFVQTRSDMRSATKELWQEFGEEIAISVTLASRQKQLPLPPSDQGQSVEGEKAVEAEKLVDTEQSVEGKNASNKSTEEAFCENDVNFLKSLRISIGDGDEGDDPELPA
jgi:hypothetical protein